MHWEFAVRLDTPIETPLLYHPVPLSLRVDGKFDLEQQAFTASLC